MYSDIKNEYTYNTDALEGKNGSAEEKGQLRPAGEIWYVLDGGQVAENIVESDTHAGGDQHVRHHRERCEIFEISHKIENDEQRQQRGHIHSQIFVRICIIVHDLLEIGGDEDDVYAAATDQIDHQERINGRPETLNK